MSDSMMIKVKITRKQTSKLFARVIKLEKLLGREQKRVADYQEAVIFLTNELIFNKSILSKERLIEHCTTGNITPAKIEQILKEVCFYIGDESDVERIDRDAQP